MKSAVRKMLDDAPSGVARRSFFKTLGLGAAGASRSGERLPRKRRPRSCRRTSNARRSRRR